jgi:hypothetical protein
MRVVKGNAAGKTAGEIVIFTGMCLGEQDGIDVRLNCTAM